MAHRFLILIGLISLINTNDCQMQGMMNMMTMIPNMVNGLRESQAKAQLSRIVKFVVGETATPSPEMVNFAVIAGSAPTTQSEKDVYLEMMQRVARRTPEVLVKFIKNENGIPKIDERKLDAHVIKRALQYASATKAKKDRQLKAEQQTRQKELDALRMNQNHELELAGVIGKSVGGMPASALNDPLFGEPLFDPMIDPFAPNYDTFPAANPAPINPQPVVNTQSVAVPKAAAPSPSTEVATAGAPTAGNGVMSLADLMKMIQQRHNPTGSQQASAGTKVNQVVPAAHINPVPTADPMMGLMMADPFMF